MVATPRFAIATLALAVAVLLLASCVTPVRLLPSSVSPTPDGVPVVWGWGRRHHAVISIPPEDWEHIRTLFHPPTDTPAAEREQVALAVRRLEQIAGEQTPIRYDAPGNQMPDVGLGQCDCVDESSNTTTWLALLRGADLLKWHDVMRPICRSAMHWSAALRDRTTGETWMIDTWEGANGDPPLVLELEPWSRRHSP